jgi:hypothetical protein
MKIYLYSSVTSEVHFDSAVPNFHAFKTGNDITSKLSTSLSPPHARANIPHIPTKANIRRRSDIQLAKKVLHSLNPNPGVGMQTVLVGPLLSGW